MVLIRLLWLVLVCRGVFALPRAGFGRAPVMTTGRRSRARRRPARRSPGPPPGSDQPGSPADTSPAGRTTLPAPRRLAPRVPDAAGAANRNANEYLLAVVMFATALFFAALSGKLRTRVAREVLLGLGGVIFLGTLAWLATFPVTITG